jgi:hypothetical protein
MSRQELAEAINLYLWQHHQIVHQCHLVTGFHLMGGARAIATSVAENR